MALTRIPGFAVDSNSTFTFANATITSNLTTGTIKTNNLLYSNGTPWSFGGSPGGSTTSVQYNNNGSFAGDNSFTFNAASGTLTVNNVVANGVGLTSLTGSNVVGQVGNSLVSGTVYSNAQPNITSVGTLTSLTVSGNISGVDAFFFDTANAPGTVGVGQLSWNDGDGTLDIGLKGGNVILQVGEELLARVYNAEANTLVDGEVVYISGAQGNRIKVNRASANAENSSYGTLGMVTESIASGSEGFITTVGVVRGLNTSSLAAGALVYLSPTTPGAYTTTKPTAPNHTVVIGYVQRVHASQGSIYVKVDNGYELDELHNVLITSPTNGQSLVYDNANSVWVNGIANIANIAYSVSGSNVVGQVSNALIAGTVYTNAQPNITSVGTLTSLTVTGNITGGNANITGVLTVPSITTSGSSGNISGADYVIANYFVGNGSQLTSITGANVTGFVPNANVANTAYAVAGGNVSGQVANALIAGTVYVNAQPNITSVGTLTSLNVSGNVTASYFIGNGSQLTGLPASYSNVNVAAYLPTYTGNLTAGNATITGTLAVPTITTTGSGGNISGADYVIANYFVGNGSQLSSLTASNIVGQVANSLVSGTVYSNAQPNITSVGSLSGLTVSGDAVVTGNLTVGGTTSYINVTSLNIKDPIIELGGGTNNAPLTTNDGKDRGTLLHYYTTGVVDAFMGWDNSNGEFAFGSNVSVSSEVVTFNSFGNVRASYYLGNGSQLTSITGSSVTGQVSNALVAGTVYNPAQPNITSVGTLTTLTVTGNASVGNILGNGYYLSGLYGSNVIGTVASATTAATVTTAAQPNITSVGTLSSLTVTGNVSAGNILSNGYYLSSIVGSNVLGQVGNALVAGTVYTNAQPNITSVGTLTTLNVSGNATASYFIGNGSQLTGLPASYSNTNVAAYLPTYTGNISANYFIGNGSTLTYITGSNVNGQVANATIAGTVYTNAQPNITSVGTLSNLTSIGTVNFINASNVSLGPIGNIKITGGTANYVLQTDGTGNLSWAAQTGGGSTSTTIAVDTFTGNGVANTYTLSVTPTSVNSVFVNYNGVFVARDSYSLSGANITFGSVPSNGSKIEITTIEGLTIGSGSFTTRTATGDNTTVNYTVTSGMTVSSVLVSLDGVLQTPTTDYTISGSTLTFTSAPATGVAIQIRELSVAASSGGGSALTIKDEGVNLSTAVTSIDFVGSGVTATNVGNAVTVSVSGASNTSIRAQAMTMGILFGG